MKIQHNAEVFLVADSRQSHEVVKRLEEMKRQLEVGGTDEVTKKAVEDAEKNIQKFASLFQRVENIAKDNQKKVNEILSNKSIGEVASEPVGAEAEGGTKTEKVSAGSQNSPKKARSQFKLITILVVVCALVIAAALYFFREHLHIRTHGRSPLLNFFVASELFRHFQTSYAFDNSLGLTSRKLVKPCLDLR